MKVARLSGIVPHKQSSTYLHRQAGSATRGSAAQGRSAAPLGRGPERAPGTPSRGEGGYPADDDAASPPSSPLPRPCCSPAIATRRGLSNHAASRWHPAVAGLRGTAPRILEHERCNCRHRLDGRASRPTARRMNGPICGQVIRCIPTALMPSGMGTRCDRATNSPPSITSVTLWMVRTRCVRPSRTIAAIGSGPG